MRKNIKKVLSILLPLIISGLTLAIVGAYVVSAYASVDTDSAVKETYRGFRLVMPRAARRAIAIGAVVILLSVLLGFVGYMSSDNKKKK